jgi:hypothetical protein
MYEINSGQQVVVLVAELTENNAKLAMDYAVRRGYDINNISQSKPVFGLFTTYGMVFKRRR